MTNFWCKTLHEHPSLLVSCPITATKELRYHLLSPQVPRPPTLSKISSLNCQSDRLTFQRHFSFALSCAHKTWQWSFERIDEGLKAQAGPSLRSVLPAVNGWVSTGGGGTLVFLWPFQNDSEDFGAICALWVPLIPLLLCSAVMGILSFATWQHTHTHTGFVAIFSGICSSVQCFVCYFLHYCHSSCILACQNTNTHLDLINI